jgi:hypothetical protein
VFADMTCLILEEKNNTLYSYGSFGSPFPGARLNMGFHFHRTSDKVLRTSPCNFCETTEQVIIIIKSVLQ